VITVVGDTSDPSLTFNHPEWLSFAGALGLGLEGARWAELLTPGVPPATVNSLTATLVLHDASPATHDPSFLRVLSHLKQGDLHDISLDMILAVVRALQFDRLPLAVGSEEIDALRRAWRTSTDQARLMLVSAVEPHPAIAQFFWEQVVPPQFEANSYRLRRVICVRLASMGTVAWHQMAGSWADLVAAAAQSDLTARSRLTKPDWLRYGLPLASLAWLLPSLSEHLAGRDREVSMRLLQDIREVVTSANTPAPGEQDVWPDVGLEISLAEGFKLASVTRRAGLSANDRPWLAEARHLLRDARSWTSEQVLCQALALVASQRSPLPAQANEAAGDERRHPLVREAVALARRTVHDAAAGHADPVEGDDWPRSPAARHIWFDDVQALEDGGFDLSAEAHRLLALSTLLINLAEGSHERAARAYLAHGQLSADVLRGVDSREMALTSDVLPKCFVSSTHAATMLDVECDCQFRLCGRAVREAVGHRQISRAFAQRAEVTAGAAAAGRRAPFVRRAFGGIWRRPEIVRDEPMSRR
jgi:hypothetical protein